MAAKTTASQDDSGMREQNKRFLPPVGDQQAILRDRQSKAQKLTVMVADDSVTVRSILRKELEAGGYRVVEAASGEEVLERLGEEKPDLVTLDVDMSNLDGFATCKRIRENEEKGGETEEPGAQRIPVIFITAHDSFEDREQGYQAGGMDFLSKPFVKGEVLALADKLLKPEQLMVGIRALVVDDSRTARMLIRSLLRAQGVTVEQAGNGQEALDILNSKENEIDLVITDLEMPIMDGLSLCAKIRSNPLWENLPVVFISSVTQKSRVLEMFRAGATDYLNKPFVKEELLARLGVHLKPMLLNRQMQENIEELKKLNKMQDELLSITSHDLRSPLNGILGFARVMQEEAYLQEPEREGLKSIEESGEYLLALINDLLDLSRLQSEANRIKWERIEVSQVVEQSITALRHMAKPKAIDLSVNEEPGSLRVWGDWNALLRVINNFVSNAIKFTREGGYVTVSWHLQGENAVISVKDNGIGIPESKQKNIFDKFSRFSRMGTGGEKGTGLGMAISHELVQAMGGEVKFESQPDRGSVFSIFLTPADKNNQ